MAGNDTLNNTGAAGDKKVVVIIGRRMFHGLEFLALKDVFQREVVVTTIATNTLLEAVGMGMHPLTVKPDIRVRNIKITDYDAVVIIGGSGAHEISSDRRAHMMVRQAVDQTII